jgi:DNA invertase Pin-like site-specific DNA recombinase
MRKTNDNGASSSEAPCCVAIYARVSTSDQNCESQLRELREYVARRGWQVVGEYVDTGWSGKLASRPELNRLMSDARLRRFDCCAVWKLDRWGRSLIQGITSITELVSIGIRFLAITQNIDTDESNPMSRFMLSILFAFADMERELIRERVTAGVRNAKRKGVRLGRKRAVFDRSKAFEMHEAGSSIREIAAALGVGVGTIHRAVFQKPAEVGVFQTTRDSRASLPALRPSPKQSRWKDTVRDRVTCNLPPFFP